MQSLPTLHRMDASTLSSLLLSPSASTTIAIIDVRDSDYVGGHIRSSIHVPSSSLDHRLPELVRTLRGKEKVVFHCALSQQRGPGAALRYLRERERMFPGKDRDGKGEGRMGVEKKIVEEGLEEKEKEGIVEVEEGDREEEGEGKEQEVWVLDGGFVGWQEVFGRDERLTEGWVEDVWKEY
ncbi:MAG: hypothetical protein LQ338_002926 [Usnochroma carphineum]|nr:MAG: hypothetical protein LQ338_002926 [Usnochroma carphineum]